jgi:DNA polymerase I-like protein with 3'-5' exonuclease and polymerase domains
VRALPDYLTDPDPELYLWGDYVCLDFETTNLDKGSALNSNNHLVLSCWYESANNVHRHGWGDEYSQHRLLEAIDKADFIVCHNAKFELHWLYRCGYDIGSKPIYDTMLAEWVIAGNRRFGFMPSLDDCLARRDMQGKVGMVSKMISAGVCPSEIPRRWLLRYCRQDVAGTVDLMRDQLEEIGGTKRLGVVYTRCIVLPALTDIERVGLCLDAELVAEEFEKHTKELCEVMKELDALTGGINPKSPPQVATYVYGELGFVEKKDRQGKPIRNKANKQFPDGMPKTDEATLLSLNPSTDDQLQFLALKKKQAQLSAALDKNLSMFHGACVEQGCMIYGVMNQTTTGTHRLSSSGRSTYYKMFDKKKGCQFQNLPNKFKGVFTARKDGWLVAEADYGQLEYRMGGFVTGDRVIYDEVDSDHDVHKFTASVMFNVPQEEVTYEQRRVSKKDTFKPTYGGSFGTPEQMKYYKAYQEKYHVMYSTQEEWCEIVANNKQLETEWGMIYYWPEAKRDRNDYLNVKTKVFNYPIQGFATAEVVPIGLAMFWHRTRDAEMFLINTVHDSLECELPENEIELFAECAVQSLTRDVYAYVSKVYNMKIDMTLSVGMVLGTHWTKSSVSEERWELAATNAVLPNFEYDDGEVTVSVKPTEEMYE